MNRDEVKQIVVEIFDVLEALNVRRPLALMALGLVEGMILAALENSVLDSWLATRASQQNGRG